MIAVTRKSGIAPFLARISNPYKLRKLSVRVGLPVVRAYARWFSSRTTLLVFTDATTAWIVPRDGYVERYTDNSVLLTKSGFSIGGEYLKKEIERGNAMRAAMDAESPMSIQEHEHMFSREN